MRYRMLVADIDGTLLTSQGTLTDATKEAVRAAVAAGCIVTLATGRRFASASPIADELGLELPIVLHNGALVKDSLTGEIFHHDHLSLEATELAITACVATGVQPILYENAFLGHGMFAGPEELDGPYAGPYLARAGDLLTRCPYDRLLPTEPPLQLSAYDDEQKIAMLQQQLVFPECRTVTSPTTTGGHFLELLSAHSSKATGIAHLAQRFGLTMDEVVAVGDNFNDVEMLREVGLGIAMANAPEAVRRQAREVTASNDEDGVARVIERYILR